MKHWCVSEGCLLKHWTKASCFQVGVRLVTLLCVQCVPAVLLDEFDRAVVADIGLGKMTNGQPTIASGRTPLWASPEQLAVCAFDPLYGAHPPLNRTATCPMLNGQVKHEP